MKKQRSDSDGQSRHETEIRGKNRKRPKKPLLRPENLGGRQPARPRGGAAEAFGRRGIGPHWPPRRLLLASVRPAIARAMSVRAASARAGGAPIGRAERTVCDDMLTSLSNGAACGRGTDVAARPTTCGGNRPPCSAWARTFHTSGIMTHQKEKCCTKRKKNCDGKTQ